MTPAEFVCYYRGRQDAMALTRLYALEGAWVNAVLQRQKRLHSGLWQRIVAASVGPRKQRKTTAQLDGEFLDLVDVHKSVQARKAERKG